MVNRVLQGFSPNLQIFNRFTLPDIRVQKNSIIQLSSAFRPDLSNDKPKLVTRSIVIPVDVPQLQVIHTVEINILSDTNYKSLTTAYAPQMVAVGQAIPAELVIRHSRSWNATQAKDEVVDVGDEDLEFFYEVQNNLEVWLVSGRKRAHFTAKVCDPNEKSARLQQAILTHHRKGKFIVSQYF